MTDNEFYLYLEGQNERQDIDRDNTRLIMWAILQKGNKKRLKPQDIMQLNIDKKRVTAIAKKVNLEEYERKREQIKRIWLNQRKKS